MRAAICYSKFRSFYSYIGVNFAWRMVNSGGNGKRSAREKFALPCRRRVEVGDGERTTDDLSPVILSRNILKYYVTMRAHKRDIWTRLLSCNVMHRNGNRNGSAITIYKTKKLSMVRFLFILCFSPKKKNSSFDVVYNQRINHILSNIYKFVFI